MWIGNNKVMIDGKWFWDEREEVPKDRVGRGQGGEEGRILGEEGGKAQ